MAGRLLPAVSSRQHRIFFHVCGAAASDRQAAVGPPPRPAEEQAAGRPRSEVARQDWSAGTAFVRLGALRVASVLPPRLGQKPTSTRYPVIWDLDVARYHAIRVAALTTFFFPPAAATWLLPSFIVIAGMGRPDLIWEVEKVPGPSARKTGKARVAWLKRHGFPQPAGGSATARAEGVIGRPGASPLPRALKLRASPSSEPRYARRGRARGVS